MVATSHLSSAGSIFYAAPCERQWCSGLGLQLQLAVQTTARGHFQAQTSPDQIAGGELADGRYFVWPWASVLAVQQSVKGPRWTSQER